MNAPVGRVVIVFTDVEASAELWSRDAEAFREALARHDTLLRAAIAAHGGYEVKTMGDAFMVAFADPLAAVRFCMSAQDALRQESWALSGPMRVRIGAHIGEPMPSPDPNSGRIDYVGPDVNKAARLAYAANGGQILLSEELRAALTSSIEILDLGEHALKGLDGRHRIWQLGAGSFRRLRTVEQRKSNLPARSDRFFGRELELEQLEARAKRGDRVITLVGPGGTGKTRLALGFGNATFGRLFEQAWWVDLSDARNGQDLLRAVAGALNLRLGGDPATQVAHALGGRGKALYIFDNVEQIVDDVRAILGRWAPRAAEATFLLTSRVPVQVSGERVVSVDPLPDQDAVALFYDRAPAPGDDADAVLALVRALDGLPLAVELAAARTRLLGPTTILARLRERFRLLRGGTGARPARHETLQACLDWSWELLGSDEREALARLSVFEGGFSLDAAEAVLGEEALERVSLLVDHSLVRRVGDRLTMLVTVREYAAEKLDEPSRRDAERRHWVYFCGFGSDEALVALLEHGAAPRLHRLAADLENLTAAAERALAAGALENAARCALAASEIYEFRGPTSEGVRLFRAVLERPELPRRVREPVLERYADLLRLEGDGRPAREALEEALAGCRERGDTRAEALALTRLGRLLRETGAQDAARLLLEESLTLHQRVGNRRAEGTTRGDLGNIAMAEGRLEDATRELERALSLHREVGDRVSEGVTLSNLGNLAFRQGRPELSRARFQAAIVVHREVGHRRAEGIALGNLGVIHRELGELVEARACNETALELHREVGNRRSEGIVLGSIGALLEDQGDLDSALAFCEAALAIHREVGNRRYEASETSRIGMLHLKHGRSDLAREPLERALGLARAAGDRPAEALTLARLAALGVATGAGDEATRRVAQSRALIPEPEREVELIRTLAWVEAGLRRPSPASPLDRVAG